MSPLAYSTETLAQALDIPASTIRRWRTTGTGPQAVKIGRHTRYPVRNVEEWLASRPVRGRAPDVSVQDRVKARQSGAGPVRNGAQNAAQPATVEQHAHTCAACGTTTHTDDSDTRPAGWITRDSRTLCVACSYVS